ncbi:hypothetical protein ElyMa_005347900 [Elysia marginata]|uniref:Ig-like domain-containing protein n=1 Tax=Elysia marginata TaxID=1093978 RepID=A0AAV4EBS9_9GAST|nr:hypothetical protein ElyMa_005347900 [Elysia marginata]
MSFPNRLCWILLLYFLGFTHFFRGVVLAQSHGCYPDSYFCEEPFYLLSMAINSCVFPTSKVMKYSAAETACKREKSSVLRDRSSSANGLYLYKDLQAKYHSRVFWIKAKAAKTGNKTCQVYTLDKRVERKACEQATFEVICEKNATLRQPLRPQVTIIKRKGYGRKIYKGTDVELSCDVNAQTVQNISIAYGTMNRRKSPGHGTDEVEMETWPRHDSGGKLCGYQTKLTFTHAVTKKDSDLTFFCFLTGEDTHCPNSGSNDKCAVRGPFQVARPPPKPIVKIISSGKPNTVFLGTVLHAECLADVDIGSKIEWAYVENNHLTHLRQSQHGVKMDMLPLSGKWLSSLYLDTQGKSWAGKDIQLICYGRGDLITLCESDQYWCQHTTVKIRQGALTPYLRIYFHRRPNIVYMGQMLEARCTSEKHTGIVWLRLKRTYGGWFETVILDNFKKQRKLDDPIYEVSNDSYGSKGEYSLSILKIHDITEDFDQNIIACSAISTPDPKKSRCRDLKDCVESKPIRVLGRQGG